MHSGKRGGQIVTMYMRGETEQLPGVGLGALRSRREAHEAGPGWPEDVKTTALSIISENEGTSPCHVWEGRKSWG